MKKGRSSSGSSRRSRAQTAEMVTPTYYNEIRRFSVVYGKRHVKSHTGSVVSRISGDRPNSVLLVGE